MPQAQGNGTYAAGAEVYDFRFNARTGRKGDTRGTMTLKRNDAAVSANADVFCLANDNAASGTPDTFAHIVKHAGEGQAECFPQTAPHAVTRGDISVRDT